MDKPLFEFKIVVAGPFGVGKTTLIANISDVPVVGTEVPTTGDEADEKDSTTVGLEYGLFSVETDELDINLLLYGTPGQERFRFMWESVSVGADGFVVLVDASRPETWDEAAEALTYFTENHAKQCIIGANRSRGASEDYERLVSHFKTDNSVPVVACDIANDRSARLLIVALLERLLEGEDPTEYEMEGDHAVRQATESSDDPTAEPGGSDRALASRH